MCGICFLNSEVLVAWKYRPIVMIWLPWSVPLSSKINPQVHENDFSDLFFHPIDQIDIRIDYKLMKQAYRSILCSILKPCVPREWVYGRETSGLTLIPMTPFHTMCRWMWIAWVQLASEYSLGSNAQLVPNSFMAILSYTGAYVRTKCMRQNLSHACIIRLLHTEVVWYTSQSLHTLFRCSLTRPHRDWCP